MARKFSPDRVINPVRRRIFRTRIGRRENLVSAALVLLVALAGAWVVAQRDNFDPADRDISIEALVEGSIAELPYHAPLQRWRPAGTRAGESTPGVPLDPFPAALLDGGFEVDGRVEHYAPENLYVKINGAAEQYLRFGFRALHYVTLARDDLLVTLEVYDQGRFAGALGVFAAQRDPERKLERADGVQFYRTSVGAIGQSGPYFFKITANRADPAARQKAASLLEVIAALPRSGAAGQDAPYAVLTGALGVDPADVSYEEENAFQYEFMSEVWFGRPAGDGGARWFLHRANDPTEAAALLSRLLEEQAYEYEAIEKDASHALMRHRHLDELFAAAVRGRWLFGVDAAPDENTARAMLSRLTEELDDEP